MTDSERAMRVAFDIGGTFTDVLVLSGDRRIATAKVLSLIDKVGDDILQCVASLNAQARPDGYVHGTTICSNAVIENKVARTGLITTKGFRDVLAVREQRGPSAPVVDWQAPAAFIPRPLCLEVDERMLVDGSVDRPLDDESLTRAIAKLREAKVEAVAVCLINSYLNPMHERRVGERLAKELPGVIVCLSCDVNPEVREYPRTATTAINASLVPVVTQYLDRLENRLEARLLIMQSNGGIMTSQAARARPMYMVESGPAAGALAAARFAGEAGLKNVLSFDMGGTTAKACLIRNGVPLEKSKVSIGAAATASGWSGDLGHILRVPSIDLVEVGAGGGSIAWNEGGMLRVGPQSAGAEPGPVCYGRGGTQPTVTDANVVLGNISPQAIGQGKLKIDREAALAALATFGAPLGLDALRAAWGITQVANAVMMRALRAVSIERGFDAREFVLMAFGGAGPIHAAALADTIGIREVVVPVFPGLFSALGLLMADFRVDHVASIGKPLSEFGAEAIHARFSAMEQAARADLERSGVPMAGLRYERRVDVRYSHQFEELTLALPPASGGDLEKTLTDHFIETHTREFGFPGRGIVTVGNLRLRAISPGSPVAIDDLLAMHVTESVRKQAPMREVFFGPERGLIRVAVHTRASIDGEMKGPLVIEEPDTTVVVPPEWSVRRESNGTLRLTRQ